MPRLSKAQVEERESFISNLFVREPNLTMDAANDQLAAKYGGMKMSPKRIYELRSTIRKSQSLPSITKGRGARKVVLAAGRKPSGPVLAVGSNVAVLKGTASEVGYFTSALEALRKVGLTGLHATVAGDTLVIQSE